MKKISRTLSGILGPLKTDELGRALDRGQRYAYLQKFFIIVVTAAIIFPLAFTAALSYFQFRSLSERETNDKLSLDALSAKQSFEFHIQESLSTMVVVAQGYGYGDLFDQTNLVTLLIRLRNEYPWVVDLGTLDASGVQRAYVGPYPFQGINYSDQAWFQNAVVRKTYVSDIFTGFRGLPHFVVTVTNGAPGTGDFWMLRASIDAQHLSSYISTINTDASTDMFLVGQDGALRTGSKNHGGSGEVYGGDLSGASRNVTLEEKGARSAHDVVAFTRLDNMPWTLVLERRGLVYGDTWSRFQLQLLAIVIMSGLVAFYIVFRVTRHMVSIIKRADKERDELLAEAQQTAKLASLGQLAAGVAHEINNPLAVIGEKIGLIRDLTNKSAEFSEQKRFLELTEGARAALERCKNITHRLLGFARRMQVEREPLQLNEVIREVVSFVEKEALYRNIHIALDLQEGLPLIVSDRGQLQQILLNIINNAIEAVEQDGSVTINTGLNESGWVRTAVADTGPGIPQNVMNHIFEPFFTTKTKSDMNRGTGLGLSITYGLVKKLCGNISVESASGQGATFNIDFPKECDLTE